MVIQLFILCYDSLSNIIRYYFHVKNKQTNLFIFKLFVFLITYLISLKNKSISFIIFDVLSK
jgi:hypothetical protein